MRGASPAWLFILGSVFTVVLTVALAESGRPLAQLQIAASLFLVVVALIVERRDRGLLPWVLRPTIGISASVLVSAIGAQSLNDADFAEYFFLWGLQVSGLLLGLVFSQAMRPTWTANVPGERRGEVVTTGARAVLLISVVAALLFFATAGVPALGSDIEQQRVNAAAEGTGYLRLLAYMSIPAAQFFVCLRHRFQWIAVITSAAIIVGMANRSPLLYLFVPILFILFAQGRLRITTGRVLAAAVAALILVVGIGTYRVVSQEEFASYAEYRTPLAEGNYAEIGLISLTHYAEVVPANAVLAKNLVDTGQLPLQWGSSYATLFETALPGSQLSLDLWIKQLSGKTFVGGGTPPTLMGEGYINFGAFGTAGSAAFVIILARYRSFRFEGLLSDSSDITRAMAGGFYGFILCWSLLSQVAGLAGASTMPLAAVLVWLTVWLSSGSRRS